MVGNFKGMRRLRLTLLGGFQARLEDGLILVLPTRKSQALLAYLALPVGALELLKEDPDLVPHLRQIVEEAGAGLASAAGHVRRLQQVIRIQTKETPVGPALDLERSAERSVG